MSDPVEEKREAVGSGPAAQEDFAAMLAAEPPVEVLQVGQTIFGRVIQIGNQDAFVDVAGKGEALLSRAELLDEGGNLAISVGDTIEATVVETRGELRLSRRLVAGAHARRMLEVAASSHLPVEGRVAGVVKGGFEVTVAGLRAFCPLSQIDLRRVEDQSAYLNRTYDFRVIELGQEGRRVVLSRRKLLEEESARIAEETRGMLTPGAILTGTISSVALFGAFVDVGGVQGLVHVSELSHRRVDHPSDAVQPGQTVTVQVLKYDPAKGKLSLSMKALEGDPWMGVAERLRPRHVVQGRVVRAADFGVFVELLPGVDGLLHVSELPRASLVTLKEAARARAEVSVMVLEIDLAKRRISLALAPQGLKPGEVAESADLAVGSIVTARVESVKPFGVLVRVGPGQTGLIPNSEMATARGTDHGKEFPAGTELVAEVIAIDQGGRRLRLSRSRAQRREERAEVEQHKAELTGGLSTLGELLRRAQQKRARS